jgi:hypothetical protein
VRRFIRNHKILTAVLTLACCCAGFIGWIGSGSTRGRLVARYDLSRGHYVVLGAGLPAPWRPDYTRLLRDRYRIELRVVAGCMVNEPLLSYLEAYNQVSMEAANREFGHDVFKEAMIDASGIWALRHPDQVRH